MKPSDVLKMVEDQDVKIVDFKFQDFPGTWQHFSVPVRELTIDSFSEGFGFDGSSIRGWQAIQESDMLVLPDPTTAFIDPFMTSAPTLSLTCTILDPITRQPYTRDPRAVALKCEQYVKSQGYDTAFIGPEAEFFVFDNARFDSGPNYAFYEVDSDEGIWNSGSENGQNLAHRPRHKEGYFPVPPVDTLQNLRTEMVMMLESLGIETEAHHHEVATAGQCEIDMRFDSLLKMADKLTLYKYVVKNVAHRNGKTVTFMPKPIFEDNGSGMHVHVSLWKGDKNCFAGSDYAGLSKEALHFVGGVVKHAPAIIAFLAPTTNSYKRLVPGFEAPVTLALSQRNRSAAIRVPTYSNSEKAKRIEFRTPDPSCNPYLGFPALVMAGLDGIANGYEPPEPIDKDLYDLSPEELSGYTSVPGSLGEALDALEKDHEFLLKDDVFTPDVIENWIKYKRENEVAPVQLRPHPHEFFLYYDC